MDKYCSRCGETITAHSPTAGEFLHEFVGHYVALEGKLWGTLRLLMFRPGRLTTDYLRGRRIPYINPLRLYLTLSLVVFALIKLVGVELPQITLDNKSIGISYAHSIPNPDRPGKPLTGTLYVQLTATSEDDRSVMRDGVALLGTVNETWTENGKRFMDAPPEEKAELLNHGFLANLPYMLIGALPLFALYLKLMYWNSGRRYGEHLVFALHATAFAFLLTIVMIILPGNFGWLVISLYEQKFALISPWDCVQFLPLVWTVAYLPAAMRHVYGGGKWAVLGKSLVLITVHLLVIFSLIVGAEITAILKHG
jgi:hypothetical protein